MRAVVALLAAGALFVLWAGNVGRGFLPSHRQVHWIEAQERSDDWTFSIAQSGDEDDENPVPEAVSAIVIRVLESSMGRTDLGEWSRWRGSHWTVTEIAHGRDVWEPWDPSKPLDDDRLHTAFSEFMEHELIPASRAIAIWPDDPYRLSVNGTHWWAMQQQFSIVILSLVVATCCLLGTVVSFIVLPLRRLTSSTTPG